MLVTAALCQDLKPLRTDVGWYWGSFQNSTLAHSAETQCTLPCLRGSFGAAPPPEHLGWQLCWRMWECAWAFPFPDNLPQTVSVHQNCHVCHTFYNLTLRNFMADLLLGVSSSSQAASLCLQSKCQKKCFWLLFPLVNIYISSWVVKVSNHLAAFFSFMYSFSTLLTLEAIDFLVMLRVTFRGQPLWWNRV